MDRLMARRPNQSSVTWQGTSCLRATQTPYLIELGNECSLDVKLVALATLFSTLNTCGQVNQRCGFEVRTHIYLPQFALFLPLSKQSVGLP